MLQHSESNQQHNNVLSHRIMSTIKYHANCISRIFKLDKDDKDDIKQDLAIAAILAKESYRPSMKANHLTYIKSAISYKAIDIMRGLENAPRIICYDDDFDLGDFEWFYQRIERDVIKELSGKNRGAKKKEKRLQLDCGGHMQNIAISSGQSNSDLMNDVTMVLWQLQPRQRAICVLLMKGISLWRIADRIGVNVNTVRREIPKIRESFIRYELNKY